MSSSRPFHNPWPVQTPVAAGSELPSPPSAHPRKRSLKRRRIRDEFAASTSKSARRQVVADQAEVDKALTDCQFNSGNNIISCFPSADTTIAQHQWASFVWNSRRPDITQTNLVDIFLFHGDSREQILHYRQVRNPSDQAGRINAQVNDSWWGSNGVKWNGENISYPFYWVLISSEKTLDGNQIAQPTFTAVQTTYADSVLASIASSSASAASVSSVSAASASSLTATITRSPVPTSSGAGSLQPSSSSSSFPHWAIAVIVVLGFLAIAATCVLAFLIIRRVRRRRQDELDSNRNSMGSASPMMANAGAPSSPLLAGGVLAGAGSVHNPEPPSVLHDMHDGASTISRTGSAAAGGAGDSGPFSGADAAIMADAFRKMLRKPDFAGGPVEEDATGTEDENGKGKHVMINRELAEEGRDIRSVRSERGVKVETLSDSGDTVQDHGDRE
ncbi:hypothetical protein Hypma_008423 [Hypsizygus marmoreus]|uniref:Uncharacterized protein n=1 Tax=Hypsizygus marmoreus TaxID=39966 RepID=A0A369JSZ7_HYPMA|nr:hypothetical protein Hypma_008423 [Hypsizygus marmoreus]